MKIETVIEARQFGSRPVKGMQSVGISKETFRVAASKFEQAFPEFGYAANFFCVQTSHWCVWQFGHFHTAHTRLERFRL